MTEPVNPVEVLQLAFPDLLEIQLVPLASLTHQREFAPGELICREGAFGETFYVLARGEVEFTKRFTADEERQLRTGGPGVYFGEMALVQRSARNANVRALTDVTVLEIDRSGFDEAIQANPDMMLDIMRTLIERMRSNDATALNEMREQKEEIERAYEELRHQEHVRSEFLTSLAHGLRTPLTAAGGYMQLLTSGIMDGPEFGEGLAKVSASLDRIISLVNDLLFVQQMETIEPNLRPVNVSDLLRTVLEELRDEIDMSGCAIYLSLPEQPAVQADPVRLARAFAELLENAVKFSPEGGDVTIALHGRKGWIDVDFVDRGVGISESFMPRMFSRFEHTDRIGKYVFDGVGLGLAIAKHIIESHGGAISVESTEGEGSTFTVHLPLDGGHPQLRDGGNRTIKPAAQDDHWVDAAADE